MQTLVPVSRVCRKIHLAGVILILAIIMAASGIVDAQATGTSTTAINLIEFSFSPLTANTTTSSQTITLRARITDTERDVRFVHVTFRGPRGIGHMYDLNNRISGNARDGVYEKSFQLHRFAEAGVWEVFSIRVIDGTDTYHRWREV